MGKYILILNASPRKNGNTAFLVEKTAAGIRASHPDAEIEIVRLDGLKISPCRACGTCRRDGRQELYCCLNDGMTGLYDKVVRADAIVLASPIYWFSLSAQMKLFMDRLYGLWLERNNVFEGKPIGALLVFGDVDVYTSGAVHAVGTIKTLWDYTKAKPAGIAYGSANDIGDAEKNTELMQRAYALGEELLNE